MLSGKRRSVEGAQRKRRSVEGAGSVVEVAVGGSAGRAGRLYGDHHGGLPAALTGPLVPAASAWPVLVAAGTLSAGRGLGFGHARILAGLLPLRALHLDDSRSRVVECEAPVAKQRGRPPGGQ